jgi:hypothetical protein
MSGYAGMVASVCIKPNTPATGNAQNSTIGLMKSATNKQQKY